MKRAWLCFFPALFVPNLGFGGATGYGVLELSDLMIGPYVLLVCLAPQCTFRISLSKPLKLMSLFVMWALVGDLLINLRYGYYNSDYMNFALLKLAKFVLYGIAGVLTTRALVDDRTRDLFVRSLVAAALVLGLGLIFVGQKSDYHISQYAGYKASNEASVRAAILACYLAGFRLEEARSRRWTRRLALAGIVLLGVGSGISEGRGGWVACIAGLLYLSFKGLSRKGALALMVSLPLFVGVFYFYSPVFRHRVDFTLSLETARPQENIGGIDDGARPQNWRDSLKQFNPPFGSGFFHRAGESGLWMSGSHNFFLQMFLETGVPGGFLILMIVWALWRQAGSEAAKIAGLQLPARAALIAAFAGGQSGEYFYGGMGLLTVLSVCAVTGSLRARSLIGGG